ncbi:16S rRNA (guanine(966)-N(2))-methyltransferase RsmD [Desulfofundulus thermobenzoicus]|uniref:16S rRNA (Guanine(966)-N(2))-methyltransferase RsmD n=1 Tax=Desulfofundulus thermobenzoicus TaxID=29376 RepID=A0A6N7IVB2_9FIRM|nr:16S rRNA (guanine(966)-N(2))-methyltransferase RsmD [Desulfofundulus thermobenzoicus]MQL54022.1 16S rRNA (guanine(966)-N(2))-methyltransferase RsmD [Desulfofundulus thermobenzoicus]
MRVIGGLAKKRRLKVPRGWTGRPTADRVKETLFNILAPWIDGCSFLDLFAGTGNVGIEALSRGAERAVFVEQDYRAVNAIRENLHHAGFVEQAELLSGDVLSVLTKLAGRGYSFDLIFLDPPYGQGLELSTLEALKDLPLLNQGGMVVVESSNKTTLPPQVGKLVLYRRHRVGDTLLSFYHVPNPATSS